MSNNIQNGAVALDREEWLKIQMDMLQVGPYIQASFEDITRKHPEYVDLVPALDPITFEADVRAACAAIAWVAEFAADKCLFIPIEEE